ncbi:MAG TPA: TIGR02281 family clan AA aspartic protease [Moraxellaceae bacterium]|nr:TIGR02281 family clan AA aspartic protease [Moraxellaceae bacterium]
MAQPLFRYILLLLLMVPAPGRAAPAEPLVDVIGLVGDRAILRIDGARVILRSGETHGAVTLLRVEKGEAVLRIGKRETHLGMSMDTSGFGPRTEGASVEIAMNGRGQFITNGMVNGRVVEFLVDTGANTVSMTSREAQRLGIDYRVDGTLTASSTAGGIVPTWVVTLKSVRVGPIQVTNVQASVLETSAMTPILLGMSFLSRVTMTQDSQRQRLRLTER